MTTNASYNGSSNDTGGSPFFSIVIPAFNRASVIADTIESCRAQTWQNFEIVVVDDGSSDGTANVVRKMAAEDSRIRLLEKENGGPAAARNHGVAHARGRYVAFLDSDDRFLPEKLERFAEVIERTGAEFVFGPVVSERGDGSRWVRPSCGPREGESIFDYLFVRRGVALPSTMVVKTDVVRRYPFFEALWFGDNDQFVVDLWEAGVSCFYLDQPLTLYADEYDAGRLSQGLVFEVDSPKHRAFFAWVESKRHGMSEQAYFAYRSRFLSRVIARTRPGMAMKDIFMAWKVGALSAPSSLRQVVQTFFPHFYRHCSDLVAKRMGRRAQDV